MGGNGSGDGVAIVQGPDVLRKEALPVSHRSFWDTMFIYIQWLLQ